MSPSQLSSELNRGVVRFLWKQWSQLGVAGEIDHRDDWVIDPEALLIATVSFGRYDARLFDEVLDWSVRNGRWLSIQRLKRLERALKDDETTRALAAVAQVLDSHDTKPRWRALTRTHTSPEESSIPFFLDAEGDPLPLIHGPDPIFESHGFLRPGVSLRGLSRPVPMIPRTNLLFRLRALFGMGPRAETVACLLSGPEHNAKALAEATGYSNPTIHETLGELAQSELVNRLRTERGRHYTLDGDRWLRFLEIGGPAPRWIEWPRVFKGFILLRSFIADTSKTELSEYLLASRILTVSQELCNTLAGTGFPNPFEGHNDLERSASLFEGRVRALVRALHAADAA